MLNLFPITMAVPQIEGLSYIPDFLSAAEEAVLLQNIDASIWLTDIARRVQHYGYKYEYNKQGTEALVRNEALPEWVQPFTHRLHERQIFLQIPDQAIVNEYLPGQGIAPHIDRTHLFTDTVVSISLSAPVIMNLFHPDTGKAHEIWLEPRSMLGLTGVARYEWKHGIAKRKSDNVNGMKIARERRVSLTFRKMKDI